MIGVLVITQFCTEPFLARTNTFEDILVVSATITDELKTQEIFLSRSFRFEDEERFPESRAQVVVAEEGGQTFNFIEETAGTYRSQQPFKVVAGRSYQLTILTEDGVTYQSNPVKAPQPTKIDAVYAERITNDFGENGMAIFVDSFDPEGSSQFYRYEYEETYKIIAPDWNPFALIPTGNEFPSTDLTNVCNVDLGARTTEERVCFASASSNDIISTNTSSLSEDRVSRFMVRFIESDNYIISHRYSILVRQYVQSFEASSFYETLKTFAESESVFSENQPGFLQGNIHSEDTSQQGVFGFFDVSSVTTKRFFFNYDAFYPDEKLPPYPFKCSRSAPLIREGLGGHEFACRLLTLVNRNQVRFVAENEGVFPMGGPYIVVDRVCGDCTALGKAEVPEFWIE